MDKKSFLLWIFFPVVILVQGQGVTETKAMYSESLNDSLNYNIYLPDEGVKPEGVLYLLHGYTGDHTDWAEKGQVTQTMNDLISSNDAIPMIVVMPDAGNSWYVNSDPEISWGFYEDALMKDLWNHIYDSYDFKDEKPSAFLAGLSMGGYGALHFAFKYPEKFHAAASLSGAFMPELPEDSDILEKTFGDPPDPKKYQQENPFELAVSDSLKQMPVYITCGDDDLRLYKYSVEMYDTLIEKGYPAELRITDGAHTWKVWRRELPKVLRFFHVYQ
ncbi:MAG: alpha/beta hydrolase [Bacteroidota bacterium]